MVQERQLVRSRAQPAACGATAAVDADDPIPAMLSKISGLVYAQEERTSAPLSEEVIMIFKVHYPDSLPDALQQTPAESEREASRQLTLRWGSLPEDSECARVLCFSVTRRPKRGLFRPSTARSIKPI